MPFVLIVLAGGLALLGCGSPYGGGTPAQQVTSWSASTGFLSTLARLRADLARMADLSSTTPPTPASTGQRARGGVLRTVCDVLVTDSLAANEQLPAPDASLTSALSDAYDHAGAAGHDCFHGAAGDRALLARAGRERVAALAGLVRAEARYDALTSTLPRSAS